VSNLRARLRFMMRPHAVILNALVRFADALRMPRLSRWARRKRIDDLFRQHRAVFERLRDMDWEEKR
jgi:hypothetical protein